MIVIWSEDFPIAVNIFHKGSRGNSKLPLQEKGSGKEVIEPNFHFLWM